MVPRNSGSRYNYHCLWQPMETWLKIVVQGGLVSRKHFIDVSMNCLLYSYDVSLNYLRLSDPCSDNGRNDELHFAYSEASGICEYDALSKSFILPWCEIESKRDVLEFGGFPVMFDFSGCWADARSQRQARGGGFAAPLLPVVKAKLQEQLRFLQLYWGIEGRFSVQNGERVDHKTFVMHDSL